MSQPMFNSLRKPPKEVNPPMQTDQHRKSSSEILITLSERSPVIVTDEEWPIIVNVEATKTGERLVVRRHQSKGYIVYGLSSTAKCGFEVPSTEDDEYLYKAVRRVAGIFGNPFLATAALAALPPRWL